MGNWGTGRLAIAQNHPTSKWLSWDLNQRSLVIESLLSASVLCVLPGPSGRLHITARLVSECSVILPWGIFLNGFKSLIYIVSLLSFFRALTLFPWHQCGGRDLMKLWDTVPATWGREWQEGGKRRVTYETLLSSCQRNRDSVLCLSLEFTEIKLKDD